MKNFCFIIGGLLICNGFLGNFFPQMVEVLGMSATATTMTGFIIVAIGRVISNQEIIIKKLNELKGK